jgi:hypothetical protein
VVLEQLARFSLDRLVAVCLRPVHLHDLAVHLKPIHLLHGLQRRLLAVEDDECLALALQTALCDHVEYGAVVLEDAGEGLFHGVDFDALLEVVDLVAIASALAHSCALRTVLTYILHNLRLALQRGPTFWA